MEHLPLSMEPAETPLRTDRLLGRPVQSQIEVSTGLVHLGIDKGAKLSKQTLQDIEDPQKVAEGVRGLHYSFERPERQMLGAPPFTSELVREITTFQSYMTSGELPNRQRVSLGMSSFTESGAVIGYQAMTLLRDANPTAYERKQLGLNEPISQAHLKLTMLSEEHWGSGLAQRLLDARMHLGKQFSERAVVDTKESNFRMHRFLRKNGFRKAQEWQTPSGAVMYRFRKSL